MKRKIDLESLPLKDWKKEATMFQDDYTAGAGTSWLLNVAKEENKMIWEMIRVIEEAPTLTAPNEWVSVEERLPDAEKEVRLFCVTPNGYKYQCQGFYVPPGMRRDDSDYSWDWECCDQYDEDSDDYFVNPGWYESSHNWDEYSAFGIADKVTYWMPLPEPPGKEG